MDTNKLDWKVAGSFAAMTFAALAYVQASGVETGALWALLGGGAASAAAGLWVRNRETSQG